MKEKLQKIREHAMAEIENSDGLAKLNDVRVSILGKKGELTAVLKGMNLIEGATAVTRNRQIGGHKA